MADKDKKPTKPRTISNDTSYEFRGAKQAVKKQTNSNPKPKEKK